MVTPLPAPASPAFATTHWSVVVSAGRADTPRSREALEVLCSKYWTPLYSYVRRRGYSPEDSQDLTQQFFARLLENKRIAAADQQRGRFRSYLLASLKNFLSDEWDKSRAEKRGGKVQVLPLQFDTGEALYGREPADNQTPEQIYERRWALSLLENVLTLLQKEFEDENKTELFDALRPCLIGERSSQPYAQLATELGITEPAIKSAVHRLRRRYRELLRQEISHTVSDSAEIEEELRYLLTILSRR